MGILDKLANAPALVELAKASFDENQRQMGEIATNLAAVAQNTAAIAQRLQAIDQAQARTLQMVKTIEDLAIWMAGVLAPLAVPVDGGDTAKTLKEGIAQHEPV